MSKDEKVVPLEKKDEFVELGNSGLSQYSGRINEEFLRQLKGRQGARVYTEMRDNSAIVGAVLFLFDVMLRQIEWRVEPESEDAADVEAATFIEECIGDMSHTWTDFISEIGSMFPFGWAYHEIVYKTRKGQTKDPKTRSRYTDGKIGWRKLPIRAQETLDKWAFDEDGGLRGMWQRSPNRYTESKLIPIEKALLFRTSVHKNNPEGRSLLRNAYRSWYYSKRIEEIEGIGIERDLAGLPVIKCPVKLMSAGAGSVEAAIFTQLKDIVQNIRRDEQEGVIMPSDLDANGNPLYELTLLSTGGTRQFDTNKILERYDRRIAMTVLSDFILLGHEQVGSFALSSDKTNLFSTAMGAFLQHIQEVMNTHAIPRLLGLNGMQGQAKLAHGDIEAPDFAVLGEFIAKTSSVGAIRTGDLELENYLRRLASLPEQLEDEDDFDLDEENDLDEEAPLPAEEQE